eukprot:CAMPEP_0113894278 /NCGR_PEP_ID=MMETSP0780_2-20120614/16619_1 /TAXON_ID=652834 /ORGANISM="Palpitomonas bilix" /LENGTH=345 /DNA_ID=CAMNT_0000884781 /DNA_START=79 /DNA_END=1116 /DNA_ORIENTATION=- /assembly_acc=CAM_ASM_000599
MAFAVSESGFAPVDVSAITAAAESKGETIALYFFADWCQPCKQLDMVVKQLAKDHAQVKFYRVDAEGRANKDMSAKYAISAVPTFLFVHDGEVVDKVVGANTAAIVEKARVHARRAPAPASASSSSAASGDTPLTEGMKAQLRKLVNADQVMLFMKGVPEEPKCKFSRRMVELLEKEGIFFSSFNILENEDVRQALKVYSNWPTYPQLYVKGELLGGMDVIEEMAGDGSLRDSIPSSHVRKTEEQLNAYLKELTHSAPVMLFMKGTPDAPRCGFSNQAVHMLREDGVEFGSFDILSDDEVRQGLKKYSDWPTYPQLYLNGELQGGLDIMKEMREDGNLKDAMGLE